LSARAHVRVPAHVRARVCDLWLCRELLVYYALLLQPHLTSSHSHSLPLSGFSSLVDSLLHESASWGSPTPPSSAPCDPENRLLVSKSLSLTWAPRGITTAQSGVAVNSQGTEWLSIDGVLGSPLASNQASLHFKQLRPSTRAGYPSNHLGPGALHSACRIVSPLVIALVRNKVKHPRPSRTDSAAAREW
jgi:hypothetical protein